MIRPLRDMAWPVTPRTWLLGLAGWTVGAACFFRATLFSSFDVIFGNRGDARLIVYLHEHLYQALLGNTAWLSPGFFHPQPHVLGFSDAFLLDIAPYGVLRLLSADPFLAMQGQFILQSFFCFMASLIICVRYLRVRPALAICAALLITFPNNLLFKTGIGHINFFAVYYLPVVALIALWGLEKFPDSDIWSHLRIAIAAALFGLLFSTSFYTAWLAAFTLLLAAIPVVLIGRAGIWAMLREHGWAMAKLAMTGLAAFALGLVPFAMIYLPVLSAVGSRTFRDYISHAQKLPDLLNVSSWNLMWGWLVDLLPVDRGAEAALIVTPGLAVIFLVLAYRHVTASGKPSWETIFVAACVSVLILSPLLTVKVGTVSLFWFVYQLVPGASAIRAGGRIYLLVNLWAVLGLALVLDRWLAAAARPDQRRRHIAAAAILAFCLAEQLNRVPIGSLSRGRELAWVAGVPSAPAECRSFLLNAAGGPLSPPDQIDAMWISLTTGRPTLNGDSGWTPPGWRLDHRAPDYFEAARQWIARSRMTESVCLYDRAARRWAAFE